MDEVINQVLSTVIASVSIWLFLEEIIYFYNCYKRKRFTDWAWMRGLWAFAGLWYVVSYILLYIVEVDSDQIRLLFIKPLILVLITIGLIETIYSRRTGHERRW